MDDFTAADYFLFLFGEIPPDTADMRLEWRPWSALYLDRLPMFFRKRRVPAIRGAADEIVSHIQSRGIPEASRGTHAPFRTIVPKWILGQSSQQRQHKPVWDAVKR
jgi:hypothetical protein